MKKIAYTTPEMECIQLKLRTSILIISGGEPGKGSELNEDEE